MTAFVVDSLADTPGVLLSAHTPSGTGATATTWALHPVANTGTMIASTNPANYFRLTGAGDCWYLASPTPSQADTYVQADFDANGATGAYTGIAVRMDPAAKTCYELRRAGYAQAWYLYKWVAGVYTSLVQYPATYAAGTIITASLAIAGNTLLVTINGVTQAQYIDSSSPITGVGRVGMTGNGSGNSTDSACILLKNFSAGLAYSVPTVYADNANWVYIGKWAHTGNGAVSEAVTLNSGSEVRGTLSGTANCVLNFDTTNCAAGQYPDIIYQIDGGNWIRSTLDATGSIACVFPTFAGVLMSTFTTHLLRIIVEGAYDSGLATVDTWNTNIGRTQFKGVTLDTTGVLLTQQVPSATIEFHGDSVTDTVRLLGNGAYSPQLKAAHIGWPLQVAQQLGMAAVPMGYGGAGIVTNSNANPAAGYSGVPIASGSFPLVYAGTPYVPTMAPSVVVVAYGTNDGGRSITPAIFQPGYQAYLSALRTAYPQALIVCVVWASMGVYSAVIAAAVAAMNDSKIVVHDYHTTTFSTSDGVHFTFAGGTTFAARLAPDIKADLVALGIKLQGSVAPQYVQSGQTTGDGTPGTLVSAIRRTGFTGGISG